MAGDARPPHGVLVPTSALRRDGDKDVLFVMKDQRAQRRVVTVGGVSGSLRQVESGVSPGEAVIIDAPPELKDAAAVKSASQ